VVYIETLLRLSLGIFELKHKDDCFGLPRAKLDTRQNPTLQTNVNYMPVQEIHPSYAVLSSPRLKPNRQLEYNAFKS
jgi:hypothetical protein